MATGQGLSLGAHPLEEENASEYVLRAYHRDVHVPSTACTIVTEKEICRRDEEGGLLSYTKACYIRWLASVSGEQT